MRPVHVLNENVEEPRFIERCYWVQRRLPPEHARRVAIKFRSMLRDDREVSEFDLRAIIESAASSYVRGD